MKNMNNFAAQQLAKKQINEVKGGKPTEIILLECAWADGRYTIITLKDLDEVLASGGNCFRI